VLPRRRTAYLAALVSAHGGELFGEKTFGDPPAASLPLCEGKRKDDPAAVLEGRVAAARYPKCCRSRSLAPVRAARDEAKKAGEHRAEYLRALRLVCLLEALYAHRLRVSELIALRAGGARRRRRSSCAARAERSGWCRSGRRRRSDARLPQAAH